MKKYIIITILACNSITLHCQIKKTVKVTPSVECKCPNLDGVLKKLLRDGQYSVASELINSGAQLTPPVLEDLQNQGVAEEVFKEAFNNTHTLTIDALVAHSLYPKDYAQQVLNDSFKILITTKERIQPKAVANIQNLLQSKALPFLDVNATIKSDWSGPDPLLALAARRVQIPLIQALLTAGADPNKQAAALMTPLVEVIQTTDAGDKAAAAKILLAAGADVNRADKFLKTPLHYAVLANLLPVVTLLLEQPQLQLDLQDYLGKTSLAYALHCNEMFVEKEVCATSNEIAKKLIARGANINRADKENMTPLMIAITSGNATGARMLIDAGADLSINSSKGMNALAYARTIKDPAIQALIPLLEQKLVPKTPTNKMDAKP